MKTIKIILYALFLSLLFTACATQSPADSEAPTIKEESSAFPAADNQTAEASLFDPLYFASEADLIEAICAVNAKKKEADDDVVIKPSKVDDRPERRYSAKADSANLASLSVFYRPSCILEGLVLDEILVADNFIFYYFSNTEGTVTTALNWYRTQSPEIHMNELFGRGAISEREIEYNGVNYVFLEWMDPWTGDSDGFSVFWVVNGECYHASIQTGYTDEEMLAFCQFEVVVVE